MLNKISKWPSLVTFYLVASLASCAMAPSNSKPISNSSRPEEISLELDRQKIEELREHIPPERRAENDQLKEILSLMGEVKEHPSRIREKYSRTTRRLRDVNRRQTKRARDLFNRDERKRRDEFYSDLKKKRERFLASQPSTTQRKDFFNDQDLKRKEFVADEKDKRNQFNADMKTSGDDFTYMMKEKDGEFQAELKNYTQRYNDFKKLEKEKINLKSSGTPGSTMKFIPPTPLHVGDDNQ